MKKVFLCLLSSSLLLSACKEKKAAKDPEPATKTNTETTTKTTPASGTGTGKYEVATPAGWERTESTAMGLTATVLLSPLEGKNDNFRENINIVSEGVSGMSLKEYVDLSEKNMAGMLTGYKKGEGGETTIDGEPGMWFSYSHNPQNIPVDAKLYVTIKNGTAYLVTASAYKNKMGKIESQLDEVVKSFHVN